MKEILRSVGQNIRNIRKQKGYSQEQLAEKSNICSKYISSIEQGARNPSLIVLCRIANALQKDVSEILSIESIPSDKERQIQRIINLLKDKEGTALSDIATALEILLDNRTQSSNRN